MTRAEQEEDKANKAAFGDFNQRLNKHEQFCRDSLIVQTEQRELVPMVLGPGQIRLREAIKEQRDAGKPVRIIYLKSRRIQATTGTAAEFFRDTAFKAGVHTVVLAHDETSVQNIFGIYERFLNRYREFGPGVANIRLPKYRALSDRIYFEYGYRPGTATLPEVPADPESSFIQIHTAGNSNFGRSFRITNVHFSEFPYYDNPGATLAAVMSAVPKLPETTAIVEGTAKSIGDYFHKMWLAAIDPSSDSEWLAIFMGWWEHPSNRMPLAIAPDRFQDSLSIEERELKGRYNLDLQQLAWRRWTIHNDFNGDMARFRREHPATPEEAFSANSRNRFSIPHIGKIHFTATAVCGELEVEDVGAGEKRLALLASEHGSEHGAFRVWRRPEKGRLYVLGADCAQGLDVNEGEGDCDPDYSVGQVLDRDTGEQCAVLRARMMPGETGRYMARVGKYYNMAQICGERNPGGGGVSMLESILGADYPSSLIYHRPSTPDRDPQVRGDRIGWDTSGVSRPILISLLDETIRQLAITLHCPITVSELMTFIIKATGKAEAQIGCHDDTVIALALAIIAITRMPRPLPVEGGNMRREVSFYGRGPQDERRGERTRVR